MLQVKWRIGGAGPAALRLVSEPSVIVQVSPAKDRCTALAGVQGVRTCRAGNWGRTLGDAAYGELDAGSNTRC